MSGDEYSIFVTAFVAPLLLCACRSAVDAHIDAQRLRLFIHGEHHAAAEQG